MDNAELEDLRARAAAGNVVSQTILGIRLMHGMDAPVDLVEAFGLLSNAASRGVPRAMHNLAIMHRRGLGTPKNLSEAVRLYERAAAAGEVLAQLELARMFANGTDVPRDDRMAAGWYASVARLRGRVDDELVDEAEAFLSKG